ncbi:MAG: GNAT family N-acetyltransferase [Alphaproteobacteria bacterium]|nr:GNAT family N-acetyltransferase [Alphaproteobacteria bacterium]
MVITYDLSLAPHSADDGIVLAGLQASNAQLTGHTTQHYSIFARKESGEIIGGALVYVGRDSAFIDVLWVDPSYRLQNIGSRLLQEAEIGAQKYDCSWVKLDTYEFQAPEFYKKCGYEMYGEVKNYTREQSKIFLRKKVKL